LNPQVSLTQYISDLQKNPSDTALREKIVRHVGKMKKAPAIPEEARRHFIEGNALLKAARDQSGYELAIEAYRQCLLQAPWWAEAYYNQAVAFDLASQFDEAMNALKLYIATNPGEEESRKAQDKIYELGAKKIIAAREREESSPQALATREQNKFADWLRTLDGRRYTTPSQGMLLIIDVRRNTLITGAISSDGYTEGQRYEIKGKRFTLPWTKIEHVRPPLEQELTFSFSEDGESVTEQIRYSDGDKREYIFLWQR
jgi:tetratricopeptide (TPR) repeat protein